MDDPIEPACHLAPLDDGLRAACLSMEVEPEQAAWIATNARSLEQAAAEPHLVPRAVVVDGEPVGFVMYEPRGSQVALHRLLIDRRHQRRGHGRRVVGTLLDDFAGRFDEVLLSTRPDNDVARQLFESFGFEEVEVEPDGEVVYRLRISSRS